MTVIVKNNTSSGKESKAPADSKLSMAFKGQIRKGSPETSISIVILSRTLFAMLVPASYILLLGVVAYFTFYHALFGLHFHQGAAFPIAAGLYVLPLVSGLSLITLMLRPFLPLAHFNEHRLKLHESDGADFLQFVSLIQQQFNTNFDVKVELSMLPVVNIEPHGLSFRQSNSITLVVGLPLIKAMTTQQLSALIAHELAHYSHSSYRHTFRWTILVDQWFDDCVQGRDGWKACFSDLEQSGYNSAKVVAGMIGKSAVAIDDSVLRYLHFAYQSLSRKTLNQLDKDADQSAVLLSGSQGFAESLHLLDKTSKSWQYCQHRLFNPTSLTLADNFVDKVSILSGIKESDDLESLRHYLPVSWNYHRDLDDRIDYAHHEQFAGIFHMKTPASDLFTYFPAICKRVTSVYYRECGIEYSLSALKPVDSNVKQQTAEDTYRAIIDDYTSSTFSPTIVWDVNDTNKLSKMSTAQLCNVLNTGIKKFRNQLPIFQDAHIHYASTQKDVLDRKILQLRLKQGYIKPEQIEHHVESNRSQKAKLDDQTVAFNVYSRCIGLRLTSAVLLNTEKSTLIKALTLLTNLQQLYLLQRPIIKGLQLSVLVSGLTSHMYSNQETQLKEKLDIYTKNLNDINRYVLSSLERLPGHLKDVDTIAGYLQEQMTLRLQPDRDDAGKAEDLFALLEREFCSLNTVITGRLVELATENELMNDIEPVRLVLKPQIKKSA